MRILFLACSCKLFWSVSREAPSFKNESYKLHMNKFFDKYMEHIILWLVKVENFLFINLISFFRKKVCLLFISACILWSKHLDHRFCQIHRCLGVMLGKDRSELVEVKEGVWKVREKRMCKHVRWVLKVSRRRRGPRNVEGRGKKKS